MSSNSVKAVLHNTGDTIRRDCYVSDPPPITLKKRKEIWQSQFYVDQELPSYSEDVLHFGLSYIIVEDPYDWRGQGTSVAHYKEISADEAKAQRALEEARVAQQALAEAQVRQAALQAELNKQAAAQMAAQNNAQPSPLMAGLGAYWQWSSGALVTSTSPQQPAAPQKTIALPEPERVKEAIHKARTALIPEPQERPKRFIKHE